MSKYLTIKAFAILLTVVLLIVLIAVAGFFIILARNSQISYGLNGTPVTTAPVSFVLNVSSPDDNSLVYDPNVLLQGKTSPGATILVSMNTADQVITVSDKGDFSSTLKLDNGVNTVIIAAFDDAGNSKTEYRTLYYSKEKL